MTTESHFQILDQEYVENIIVRRYTVTLHCQAKSDILHSHVSLVSRVSRDLEIAAWTKEILLHLPLKYITHLSLSLMRDIPTTTYLFVKSPIFSKYKKHADRKDIYKIKLHHIHCL